MPVGKLRPRRTDIIVLKKLWVPPTRIGDVPVPLDDQTVRRFNVVRQFAQDESGILRGGLKHGYHDHFQSRYGPRRLLVREQLARPEVGRALTDLDGLQRGLEVDRRGGDQGDRG